MIKKILKFLASFLPVFFLLPLAVGATVPDACDQEFVYTKTGDFSDSRVLINFEVSDLQIDVSAQDGYEVIKVELDADDDGHVGFWQYATGPLNNFNPHPANELNSARVTVKKVCAPPPPVDVCTDIEGNQETVPVGHHQDGPNCPVDQTEATSTPPVTPPTPSPEPSPKPSGGSTPSGGRHPVLLSDGTYFCPNPLRADNDPMGHCAGKYVVSPTAGAGNDVADDFETLKLKLIEAMQKLVILLQLKLKAQLMLGWDAKM